MPWKFCNFPLFHNVFVNHLSNIYLHWPIRLGYYQASPSTCLYWSRWIRLHYKPRMSSIKATEPIAFLRPVTLRWSGFKRFKSVGWVRWDADVLRLLWIQLMLRWHSAGDLYPQRVTLRIRNPFIPLIKYSFHISEHISVHEIIHYYIRIYLYLKFISYFSLLYKKIHINFICWAVVWGVVARHSKWLKYVCLCQQR